ncbi:Flp family type IVb pilin [Microvirga alba]|uniref:Flp family type IVb pilin n=1 Tax=Microvirga alba TaxID=2791025 RepID=A0A931FR94_9HYPH|nr:Flp family type IVb pilin [Microvirga alba]MBF9235507.1 Flp family type IVb pilin [Microvirga alba]
MKSLLDRFLKGEAGAVAIEYGLIACLVSIVIVAALTLMAPQVEGLYITIKDAVVSALR